MPRFNKWLSEIEPDEPVNRVGRKALQVRLAAVVHYLQAATKGADRAEAIHQLRIWTRRSAAALRLFDPLVPQSAGKKLKKRLRKIRAAAGEERDCDVLLERLRADEVEPPRAVARALKKRRRRARRMFNTLRQRKLQRNKLQQQCAKLIDKLAWPKRHSSRQAPPFAAWCRAQLEPLAQQFFSHADAMLSHDDRLHELRIAGKRLRYALELSPAALPARLHERLYAALTDLQERLGAVCDHVSAISRLEEWLSGAESREDRQTIRLQIQKEQEQLTKHRRQFLRWWSAARRRRLRRDWDAAVASRTS